MAIIRSNGILTVDSIPTHTPANNEATLAVLNEGTTVWYWDGNSWEVAPFSYNFANQNLTFTGARTHDAAGFDFTLQNGRDFYFEVQESTSGAEDGSITLEAFSTNGSDRIEILNGQINIIKNYGANYTQFKLDDNGVWLLQSEGKYLIGDGLGFGIGDPTTDADATHDLVWDSATARLGKRVKPKVFKARVSVQDNSPSPFTVSFYAIFENTLGEIPTISIDGSGEHLIQTIGNVFTTDKTFAQITSSGTNFRATTRPGNDETEWVIETQNGTSGVQEFIDGDMFLSIEVYP